MLVKILKETNAQAVKDFFYKFLTIKRGHFNFMFKNNVRVFLDIDDFKRC
jgi:hypothetical protein